MEAFLGASVDSNPPHRSNKAVDFHPSGLMMNIQLSFPTISSPSGQHSPPPPPSPCHPPSFLILSFSSLLIVFYCAPRPTHLLVLIWKTELEVLAVFCSELCGVQLNRKSGGGKRQFLRGCRGLACLKCLRLKTLFSGEASLQHIYSCYSTNKVKGKSWIYYIFCCYLPFPTLFVALLTDYWFLLNR